MFEKASRLKVRFNYKGLCTVEDLWDLPLTSLDYMFKLLNSAMKTQKEESLLETKSTEEEVLDLKIAIIRYVVEKRKEENKAKLNKANILKEKKKILEIIAKKQDGALEDLDIVALQKRYDEL